MSAQAKLAQAIRDRLAEIDGERKHLLALVRQYENGTSPTPPVQTRQKAPRPKTSPKTTGPRENEGDGPTERVLKVIEANPGLRYGEIIKLAIQGMETEATNPQRSAGSVLGSLVKREKIEKVDGRYYLPGEAAKGDRLL
jgi:hypothetical protein